MKEKSKEKSSNIKIKTTKTDNFLESIGLKYFQRISNQFKSKNSIKFDDIPSDNVLNVVSHNVMLTSVIIAVLVGALTTIPAVWFQYFYHDSFDSFYYYLILSIVTVLFLIIEVGVLYWLSMRAVYTLAYLTGFKENDSSIPSQYDVKNIMVRSALELEDPIIEYLGINPHKYVSKKWLFVRTLLYKAKIVLSTLILRIILQKLALRFGVRMSFLWLTIPVTAIWDGVVMFRVIKDAKLRLFGYHLSRYIAEEIITDKFLNNYSPDVKEGAIRAISTVVILSKNYHPNSITLLLRLNQHLEINQAKDYDDLEKFLEYLETTTAKEKHLLRTLSAMSAVFDGEINRGERTALKRIFANEEKYMNFAKELKKLLLEGSIHQSAHICEEMVYGVCGSGNNPSLT